MTEGGYATLASLTVALILAVMLWVIGAPAWGAGGFGSIAYLVMVHGFSK